MRNVIDNVRANNMLSFLNYDHFEGDKNPIFNDILHMSFLAGTHVFKAFPAYTTTEL